MKERSGWEDTRIVHGSKRHPFLRKTVSKNSNNPPKPEVLTRGRSTWPSLDRDRDLFIGREGIAKLLAESL
jgi:hypothetical protein